MRWRVFSLILDLDIGFVSMTVAAVLALASPKAQKGAVSQISWSTVLLIGGVLTFVGVLQEAGSVEWVGNGVAKLGMPLLVALLLCYLGAHRVGFRIVYRHPGRHHPVGRATAARR